MGEFGYELLNWQGTIRKFSRKCSKNERIISCSRRGLSLLYENVFRFLDISEITSFKESSADSYNIRGVSKDHIKQDIVEHVFSSMPFIEKSKYRFFFSSAGTEFRGLKFGNSKGRDIYSNLNLNNNEFAQIGFVEHRRNLIEDELRIDLNEEYILFQNARRDIVNRTTDVIDEKILIEKLINRTKVVVLNFLTGRSLDSYSRFDQLNGVYSYNAANFEDQSVLVHYAKNCVFFTEGDFRSHIYIPPFMGKNVYAVASNNVFKLDSAPIEFWNNNIFRFGGQIIPVIWEEIVKDDQKMKHLVNSLC